MDTETLTFTGPSALAIIRASRLRGGPRLVPTGLTGVPAPPRGFPPTDALLSLLPCLVDIDGHAASLLHIRVPGKAERVRRPGVVCRQTSGTYPPGSFWEVRPDPGREKVAEASGPGIKGLRILVDSPPLALARQAGLLCSQDRAEGRRPGSFEAYVRILSDELELCGCYGRDPLGRKGVNCVYDLRPVTSAEDIARFLGLGDAAGGEGARLMRLGQRSVVDNLRSPLEAATHLCMLPSPHWGGLSFPSYECNGMLELPRGVTTTSGLERVMPDFLWRDQGVVLETEGFATHGTRAGRASDNRRLRFYNDCGVTVVPALFDEVCTRRGMDALLAGVAHLLCERSGDEGALMARRFKRAFADKTGSARRNVILGTILPVDRPGT